MAGSYDYHQMTDLVAAYYGSGSDQWLKVVGAKETSGAELLQILKQTPGVETLVTESGQYAGWRLAAQESYGAVSNVGSLVNSNTAGGASSVQTSGLIQVPGNFTETAGTVGAGSGAVAAASGASVTAVAGTAIAATLAVSTGISLGKTIDKAIYEGGQALGFSAEDLKYYDPDTWGDISLMLRESGHPVAETLFNVLFDVDPSKETSQMYIDETAYAYMTYALKQMGFFDSDGIKLSDDEASVLNYPPPDYSYTVIRGDSASVVAKNGRWSTTCTTVSGDAKWLIYGEVDRNGLRMVPYSLNPFTVNVESKSGSNITNTKLSSVRSVINGKTVYYIYDSSLGASAGYPNKIEDIAYFTPGLSTRTPTIGSVSDSKVFKDILYVALYGTPSGRPGVGTQSDSVNPDISKFTDVSTALSYLKTLYPDLWKKAIYNDVLQPDGTIKRFTYIPVPTPTSKGKYDTQPTGDGSEQNQNHTDVSTDSSTAIKHLITTTITSPPDTPNPPDTGGGSSPTVVPPVGKASSLWSIYNPTLEQVNQFGSWLWSSNFVEQLKKLFNDPMQAIIGLHKVYSPVQTSGQGTIKCGYLDSGVPSKLVSEQYVTVDCGSVDLQEYFGNVFDYPPYTEVSIYLPFIGIRHLDPSDIMRSTISVIYHIDVLTGVCLAEVNVQRDAAGGTLYTFSGDAAVRYPVSSGSYMGIVSGLIGVATSVVSGNLLPALGGVTRLHTNVDRSGSFTGNAGAMGSKIPYLIISRPQTAMADQFETLSGYPSNTYTPLSACKGFTQVKYCHVENLNATDAEKQEIEQLLKEGVIL